MSTRFNMAVEKNIFPEILMIQERFKESGQELGDIDVLLSCSKEQLIELLKSKRIDEEIINFVAHEDDVKVIFRAIKMINRYIPFSSSLVTYARNEAKAEILDETCDYIFSQDAYEIFAGMSISRMREVLNALKAGIKLEKIKRFMLDIDAGQMVQIRKAIKSSLSSDRLRYLHGLAKNMSAEELREIRKLMDSSRWSIDDIEWLVKKNFCKDKLACVRKAYEHISGEQLTFLVNSEFDATKMKYVSEAFMCGLTIKEVQECTSFDTRTCRDMLEHIEIQKLYDII